MPRTCLYLDTYHANIEKVPRRRSSMRVITSATSPVKSTAELGMGAVDWDEIFVALRAIDFKGGLAMESFVNMRPK